MSDLFSHQGDRLLQRIAPLAERLRPRTLDDFVGQEAILGPGRLLRRAIMADRVGNLILHGPPGTGKTTLARIIAHTTRAHFSSLNAVLAGVKELRAEVMAARQRLDRHEWRTILFIDEVHRFNSAQQDALLPWVENGTVSLIGATTENPFFEVNKALVSRSRLFRLQPLEPAHLRRLLERALTDGDHGYGSRPVLLDDDAAEHLLAVAGGDARSLLNALELAVDTTPADEQGRIHITLAIAEESIQQRAVLYDKQGDAHFDTISAFIKSIRGSDADATLFWLARMVEAGENPRFIFRRLLIAASEDIGLADPQAMVVVEACAAAFERIGLPEGLYPLTQASLYLAATNKSNSSLGFFDAVRTVRQAQRQEVPAHLRDANRDGQAFGDGVGYRYPHAYADHWVAQQYLPTALQGQLFWQPGDLGWEGQQRQQLQRRRAAQLAAAVEQEAEQVGCLSSGPEDPLLERWLQRQAAAEGARLDQLRQRFWQGAQLGRLDRVLVLRARSLLWALDPLQACGDGEVLLTLASSGDQERVEAQVQVLDPLLRPRLLPVADDQPEQLLAQIGSGPRLEWIVGRQPFLGLQPSLMERWLDGLGAVAAPGCRLRLLVSHPLLGPAGALGNGGSLAEAEQTWLETERLDGEALQEQLQRRGWRMTEPRIWRETLDLRVGDALVARWFGEGAAYRQRATAAGAAAELNRLEQQLRQRRGGSLPQPLEHRLLEGRLLD
ncbi:MAG: AAA family ATPase [Cyanobacteriota bacterium]|nr:AAA family ATPase [Cyanobacteriota bacterium]